MSRIGANTWNGRRYEVRHGDSLGEKPSLGDSRGEACLTGQVGMFALVPLHRHQKSHHLVPVGLELLEGSMASCVHEGFWLMPQPSIS